MAATSVRDVDRPNIALFKLPRSLGSSVEVAAVVVYSLVVSGLYVKYNT